MSTPPPSDRIRVRRLPKRGLYDKDTIYSVLDEGLICHVGFLVDGQPYVIPTGYARDGDQLIIHGSSASRMLRELSEGIELCVTVTLLDALVLARSAFHHSMNYRSVVVLGRATLIDDPDMRIDAMRMLTDHIIPGRWDDCRQPNAQELKATVMLEIPLDEASAKVRTGPPGDDDEDYDLPYWAGLIPFAPEALAPTPDPKLTPGIDVPSYVTGYARKKPAG